MSPTFRPSRAAVTAVQQLSASTVDPSKSNATPNPFQNVNVVSEPRLDEDSTTKWYQAANVDDVDTVEVCFLEGERQPALDQEDGFMVDGHVCAAKVIDHRGLVCNPWGG